MDQFVAQLKPIPQARYLSEDILDLAQFFLGQYIVTRLNNITTVARIVETEAYRAPDDKGSHAYQNKRTKRTETIFQKGGKAYIYLCYGLHHMFNIVSGPENTAHAILIRAVEPIYGSDQMKTRRKLEHDINITNGPGKLCQALGISTQLDGIDITNDSSSIWIAEGSEVSKEEIIASPRVGIAYAQECALWDWRFRVKSNAWTSKPDIVKY